MPSSGRNDLIERGRNELTELVDSVAPTVESTIRSVSEKAPPILEQGQKMARKKRKHLEASLATSLPEPLVERLPIQSQRRKRRRLRTVLLLGGLAAAGVVVARKLMDSRAEAGWQSTYEPRPSSTPPSGIPTGGPAQEAAVPPTTSSGDAGAASPGEAMSDQAEHAHRDTDPDDPAYVEQLDGAPETPDQRPGL
jgi:hypothetical protein